MLVELAWNIFEVFNNKNGLIFPIIKLNVLMELSFNSNLNSIYIANDPR